MNWLGDHDREWSPGIDKGASHRVLITTADRRVAVDENGAPLFVNLNNSLISDQEPCLAGTLNGVTYFGVRTPEVAELSYEPLRPVLSRLNSEDFIPVNAVMQLLDFFEEHRFCGRCGDKMGASKSDRGRYCEPCGLTHYPRISPCVIVLITRGDEILLARAPRFVDGMYSTLAGFVEAGESAEHACHREIGEEVGVCIKSPIYQGSQSWPFKHSLMLGYRAEWLSGDIVIDEIEIVDAQWFNIKHLPKLPPHASISRGMIDAYIKERLSKPEPLAIDQAELSSTLR